VALVQLKCYHCPALELKVFVSLAMRKLTLILPILAILLAAVVLAGDLGSSVSAQTPESTMATMTKEEDYATADDGDLTTTSWTETGLRHPDSRKPRLPHPKHPKAKVPKKKK
jgi:hypothetical protein